MRGIQFALRFAVSESMPGCGGEIGEGFSGRGGEHGVAFV
jgi:hypothetical protein